MRRLGPLLGVLASLTVAAAARAEPYTLANTHVGQVTGASGAAYRIMVAWPETPPPARGWPVLYVLDGEDNFAAAVTTARRLARAGGRSGVAPGVIVGVESGDLARRVYDYTPPVPGYAIPAGAPAAGLATGGADQFLDDLSARIAPEVAKEARIDPSRQALLGHSFGGVAVLHALLTARGAFSTFIAVSPSFWFGDGLMMRESAAFTSPARPLRVVVATGDERGPDGANAPAADAFVQRLRLKQVDAAFQSLPGLGHGGTMLAAMARAVAVAFADPAAAK